MSFTCEELITLWIAPTGAMSDTAPFHTIWQQSGAAADVTAVGAGQQPCCLDQKVMNACAGRLQIA